MRSSAVLFHHFDSLRLESREKELTLEAVLFISRKKNRVVCPRVINDFIVTNELRSLIVSSFEG